MFDRMERADRKAALKEWRERGPHTGVPSHEL
jgi:hypothetical protein